MRRTITTCRPLVLAATLFAVACGAPDEPHERLPCSVVMSMALGDTLDCWAPLVIQYNSVTDTSRFIANVATKPSLTANLRFKGEPVIGSYGSDTSAIIGQMTAAQGSFTWIAFTSALVKSGNFTLTLTQITQTSTGATLKNYEVRGSVTALLLKQAATATQDLGVVWTF